MQIPAYFLENLLWIIILKLIDKAKMFHVKHYK